MKKLLFVGICLLSLLCGGFHVGALPVDFDCGVFADGNTLCVGGSGAGNYSTIQEALHAATDGDTVFVYDDSSPYFEHIVISNEVNVFGENKGTTVIDGNGSGVVVSIVAHGVMLSGFTIRNGETGVDIDGSFDNISIVENVVENHVLAGINFRGINEYVTVSSNIVRNCFNGTDMTGVSYSSIVWNSFEDNENALTLNLWCNENDIHFNNFLNNGRDVFFFTSILNSWHFNYWDRPRILPKVIIGMAFFVPVVRFDLRPRLMPHQL